MRARSTIESDLGEAETRGSGMHIILAMRLLLEVALDVRAILTKRAAVSS